MTDEERKKFSEIVDNVWKASFYGHNAGQEVLGITMPVAMFLARGARELLGEPEPDAGPPPLSRWQRLKIWWAS